MLLHPHLYRKYGNIWAGNLVHLLSADCVSSLYVIFTHLKLCLCAIRISRLADEDPCGRVHSNPAHNFGGISIRRQLAVESTD
jgi:hypothetical protein